MSTATAVTMLDVRAGSGAITLPLTTEIAYRVLTIKDAYGAAGLSSITINTQGTDVFENGASSITLTNAYDTTTLYAGQPGYWYTIGGSRLAATSFNTLSTGLITNPLRLGTISTQTAIQFTGLRQGYTGTVIAEQGTGAGTQELLLYKASSISDQIRLQTTGNIVFEAGASARSFPSTQALATPTLYIQGTTSNIGIGTATPAATLDVAGTGRFQSLSTLSLNISTINGQTTSQLAAIPIQSTVTGLATAGYISSTQLNSTVSGLATAGYISSTQLYSTVRGLVIVAASAFTGSTNFISASLVQATTLSTQLINTSTLNSVYLSSSRGYISSLYTDNLTVGATDGYVTIRDLITGTVSTGQMVSGQGFISSLQINSLSFGPTGYVIVGNFIASSLSTMKLNTQNLYTNNAYIGNASTQSAILFPGVDGTFRGTAIAEQVTGPGTEELLLYKVSTTSDQIRLQTTGNIVFEAGAPSRSWPSTSALATPTLYIQGTTSNVGIGTASPATTLDVIGTGRFQFLSSYTINVSSINGIIPGEGFNGSTVSLSSATIRTSTVTTNRLGTNTLTTSSITSYGTVDVQGSVLSNVATEYFVKPVYASIFTPASISGLKVWLDASKLTSITSNGSAQVTVLSNLAGFGNALSNSGITPPTTGAYSINNLNTLSFTGQNSLKLPSIAYTSSDRSLFVVAQTTGNSAFYGVGSNAGSITASLYSTYYYGWERNNVTQQNLGTAIYNTPFLVAIYKTTTSNGVIVNGSNLGATPTTFTPGTYVDQIGVAGSPTGNIGPEYYGASWNFAEAIVYDGPLTPSERQTVEGYLAWKWGFQASLIITHPYYFTVPPPFGTDFIPTGSITTDANSNVSFAANNKLLLLAPVEIPTTLSTASLTVSTINGESPLTILNLTSTVAGTNSNISSMIDPTELTSTITGLGTAGFISTVGLTYVVASTAQGLGTFGYTSTNQLLSTTIGVYGAIGSNIATTVQPQFISTLQGLGTAGYISSTQLYSTVTGIGPGFTGSTIRLSSAQITTSTISSFLITTGSLNTGTISTNALVFGSGTGTLLMPDISPNTLYTSTVTASNIQVGWGSNQSPLQFYGFGTYTNSVIVEQSTGTTTQELLMFRGSNAADRIRLQTTGYLSIETGVSSRLYPNTGSNALPTIMIDTRSNVGILLSTPLFTLDVGSTVRAVALSTLHLQTSTIQGATFNRNLFVNFASTFLMDEVSTSFLQGNYNNLLFRTAGTQRAVFTQAGNLGVGMNNPQYIVDIAGTTRLSTLLYSTSIAYSMISAPLLMVSTVNTENAQITNVSSGQINASTIYGRWNDAQYYVLQTL